ncbi:hypothetical protein LCGC14_1190960 [marine sediment metagenome]|uniref:Asn/Gln amidotransferase domain-containing protein n=1 Tax=marine sediment metagenome TaxID=412755 RepID=A0A0F9P217_9ZZZZ
MLSKKYENSLDVVITEMKELKKKITKEFILNYVVSQVFAGTRLGAKLSKITRKQVVLYCEKNKIK